MGLLHHLQFKKFQRRGIFSYAHLWVGRCMVTLGMVNGALGIKIGHNTPQNYTALETMYGIFAGIVWCVWMTAAVSDEIKRWKHRIWEAYEKQYLEGRLKESESNRLKTWPYDRGDYFAPPTRTVHKDRNAYSSSTGERRTITVSPG